ncbi:uncharacterized protein LOC111693814 [Trichogramma pretiosum]|uniref:uncharacterized protein LOC111693814 n=1 Tax=Trichogramma pretiosum TaxID=7493 RepID=UPI000C71B6A4|nr:uncharacterized protein LOC111693814 [Trichogramma pretiosum]
MQEARSFLRNNQHLFFTKADKGNATVCIKVDDYTGKMTTLLSDDETCEKIDHDPFESLQTRTKILLKEVNEECDRNLSIFQLSLSDTSLARAYGLPKIHEKDVPLRPIITLAGSPTYVLAKIFYEELALVIKPPASYFDNSFDFKSKFANISIPTDYVLVSLDVVSLFTNVPLELVLESLDRRYSDLCKSHLSFNKIREVMIFLFNNTYLKFNNTFYRQTYRTPMGSCISSLAADLMMEDLEKHCLSVLKQRRCIPLFYYRYVDDIILCINKKDIELTVDVFNSYNGKLKFTHEVKQDKKLNFLVSSSCP